MVYGDGVLTRLKDEIEKKGGRRAIVLSGKSLAEQTDIVPRVQELLGALCVGVYSGLTQRAPLPSVIEATEMALRCGADTLVGLGGSTVSDAAKAITGMVANGITDGNALRAYAKQLAETGDVSIGDGMLPLLVVVPTTLSAGEFNWGGRVQGEEPGETIRLRHPSMLPSLIFLDPQTTMGTPDWLWLSTGIKALDHCVERLYVQGAQPAVDGSLLLGVELLFQNLPRSREKARDLQARLRCQIAAWLSMTGMPNSMFGLSHAIGHVIGRRHGVPHGVTSCVTLPHVMEFNRPASVDKQAMLAKAAGVDTLDMSIDATAIQGAQAVERLILDLELPHRIRDLGLSKEDLPLISELVLYDNGARHNPVPITSVEQVMQVLERAW